MEKRGVVETGRTPDTESQSGEKRASTPKPVEQLDDDFTKRAADAAAAKLRKSGS